MTAGVYRIHCKPTDTFYVGETSNFEKRIRTQHARELRDGRHPNRHLQRAWNRYGRAAFSFDLVWAAPAESVAALCSYELSELTRSMEAVIGHAMIEAGFRLFNIRGFDRWGASSPMTTDAIRSRAAAALRSPEVRAKLSAAARRARTDPEKLARLHAAIRVESAQSKRAASMREAWADPEQRDRRTAYWTDDARAQQSDRMRAVLGAPAVAAKVRRTIEANKKKVKRLDTGQEFASVIEAANAHNTSSQNIIQAIKNGWRARGTYWAYA